MYILEYGRGVVLNYNYVIKVVLKNPFGKLRTELVVICSALKAVA